MPTIVDDLQKEVGRAGYGKITLRVGIVVDVDTPTLIGCLVGDFPGNSPVTRLFANYARVTISVVDENGAWTTYYQVPMTRSAFDHAPDMLERFFNRAGMWTNALAIVAFLGESRTTENAIIIDFFDPQANGSKAPNPNQSKSTNGQSTASGSQQNASTP